MWALITGLWGGGEVPVLYNIIIRTLPSVIVSQRLIFLSSRVKGWNPFEDSVNFGAMSEDNIFGKKSALKKLGRRAK